MIYLVLGLVLLAELIVAYALYKERQGIHPWAYLSPKERQSVIASKLMKEGIQLCKVCMVEIDSLGGTVDVCPKHGGYDLVTIKPEEPVKTGREVWEERRPYLGKAVTPAYMLFDFGKEDSEI